MVKEREREVKTPHKLDKDILRNKTNKQTNKQTDDYNKLNNKEENKKQKQQHCVFMINRKGHVFGETFSLASFV